MVETRRLLPPADGAADDDRLIERLTLAPSRAWANDYFDLMHYLCSATGLTNGDRRLVTSIPGRGRFELPVSVNHRWVLAPCDNAKTVGFIYGAEFESQPMIQKAVSRHGRFAALRGERGQDVPYFLRIKSASRLLRTAELRAGWIEAVFAEMERARSSPYRKYHQPVVYEAAMNLHYRQTLFTSAFGESQTPGGQPA